MRNRIDRRKGVRPPIYRWGDTDPAQLLAYAIIITGVLVLAIGG